MRFMPFAVPLALNSHLSPTLLPGGTPNETLNGSCPDCYIQRTVWLRETSDVQSILMGRENIVSRPGFGIKPDLSADDRKIESLLLKDRRSLIVSGVERKNNRISVSTIYVNKQKYGIVLAGGFQKSSDVIHAPSCSPSRISLASDTSYHSTPTGVDVAASQSDLRNPSHASKHLS